jgi:hypothetical protein
VARVSHVCLSDLHLGADTAILTDTPAVFPHLPEVSADPLRHTLAQALTATLEFLDHGKPQPSAPSLVLLGDIMDFSLGTPAKAIASFDRLLQALTPLKDRLGPTIFLPGNHDHELWTVSRFMAMGQQTPGEAARSHTTKAFGNLEAMPRTGVIDGILVRNGFPGCTTFYPNMGLRSRDLNRTIVLHHGHFLESMYRVISTLIGELDGSAKMPGDVETLEQQNSSWIDFVWSNFGDDGLLGKEARLGYDYLLTGREDVRFDRRLAAVLSKRLMAALPVPQTAVAQQWVGAAMNAMIEVMLGSYGQTDRFNYSIPLSADATEGLNSYLSQIVVAQMKEEQLPDPKKTDLTFIFGHTHKPFESRYPVPGFDRPPAVYNTGGWDLDMPMFGTLLGASAVFIDEDLNVASLRLCAVPESEGHASAPVRVGTADGTLDGNPLAERLERALHHTSTLWTRFSKEATRAYHAKQAYIFASMSQADKRDKDDGRAL